MVETSITKKVSDYKFDKCHLPRLYDGTIINNELHVNINDKSYITVKYKINDCFNLENPIKINNDTNDGYDYITSSVMRKTVNFFTRDDEIYYSINDELTVKLLQRENTDNSLINMIMNSFLIG